MSEWASFGMSKRLGILRYLSFIDRGFRVISRLRASHANPLKPMYFLLGNGIEWSSLGSEVVLLDSFWGFCLLQGNSTFLVDITKSIDLSLSLRESRNPYVTSERTKKKTESMQRIYIYFWKQVSRIDLIHVRITLIWGPTTCCDMWGNWFWLWNIRKEISQLAIRWEREVICQLNHDFLPSSIGRFDRWVWTDIQALYA